MSSASDIYGHLFFVRWESGIVSHLSIPVHPDVVPLERAMRAEFDALAVAGGSSVRLQFTETLDTSLTEPHRGPKIDWLIAASALGLLRLYGSESLAVLDRDDHYEYVPIADAEDHLSSLRIHGRLVARPATSRWVH